MIAIIANPNALHFNVQNLRNIKNCLEQSGLKTDIFFTQRAKDGTKIANLIKNHYDIIASYGGDGIVNEVINAKLPDSASFAVIPAGTTNVLSIELGIKSYSNAVEAIKNKKTKKAYICDIDGKKFILMAGIGFDAEAVLNVNEKLKKISGKFSYVLSGATSYLKKSSYEEIEVEINKKRYRALWVIASNAERYAGSFRISRSINIFHKTMDISVFKSANRFLSLPFYNLFLFSGMHSFSRRIQHIKTDRMKIITKNIPIQIDGDFYGYSPCEISILEKPINIIVP